MTRDSFRKLKASLEQLSAKLRRTAVSSNAKNENGDKGQKHVLERFLSLSYQLVGSRSARFLPLFKDMDWNLVKSGLKANFKAYVSLTILASCFTASSVAAVTVLSLLLVLNLPPGSAVLFGIGIALFAWAASITGFYLYPIYRADKHKRELDDEIPFTTGYMSILASAGVSPEKIFQSLSNVETPLAASSEAKEVVKHINLFGLDIISSLEKTSARTPSEKFQELIEGMISTIHTGGNLGSYLREKFKTHMRLKRISLKKYSDSLSVFSEIYVALLLTGPLLLVIMLSVMSVLGSGTLGTFSSDFLLSLITYIGIPACALIFLIILDSSSPKW